MMRKEKTKNPLWVRVSQKILSRFSGKPVYLSNMPPSPIAVVAVFWYIENGVRHFLFIKKKNESLRFPSCLGLKNGKNVSQTLIDSIHKTCGNAFVKSLPKSALTLDNKPLTMVFGYEDSFSGKTYPLHTFIWSIQITPEQASLSVSEDALADIYAIGEPGFHQEDITESHLQIAQMLINHTLQPLGADPVSDMLEDFLKGVTNHERIIH